MVVIQCKTTKNVNTPTTTINLVQKPNPRCVRPIFNWILFRLPCSGHDFGSHSHFVTVYISYTFYSFSFDRSLAHTHFVSTSNTKRVCSFKQFSFRRLICIYMPLTLSLPLITIFLSLCRFMYIHTQREREKENIMCVCVCMLIFGWQGKEMRTVGHDTISNVF